jgi:hypothetical protein
MRTLTMAAVMMLAGEGVLAGVCPAVTVKGSMVTGNVCFESGSKCVAIPGAHIELTDKIGHPVKTVTADEKGNFRLDPPATGQFGLGVNAGGFHKVECRFVALKKGRPEKILKVVLGSDAILPCGGSRITELVK